MITGDTKQKIDAIWDVFWTGGITTGITILEQMTYLLFMKMLDEEQKQREKTANLFGGVKILDAVFPEGDWTNPETNKQVPFASLRWMNFKQMEPETMFNHVTQNVFPFIKNLNSGKNSSYSRFMQSAIFLIPTPKTLTKLVDAIEQLVSENSKRDFMGDFYEYMLGKMAESGNNGQFRTPRHIIDMMVNLMQPTLNDVVCDPAMGSAGFIVQTAKYLRTNFKAELTNKEHMNNFKNEMFHGFDTDQTMLRIGAMNLMLNGVENPDVKYQDSLSDENEDANRYTLCLANPPFAGSLDKDHVHKSLQSITNTKKTELLFVALFVRMLQVGGRCASIVPDGVLFGTSTAHQSLRKELVDNQKLQAVISMPSGVFQPYSGVSTAILIFTKTNSGGTDNVWFYEMHADGFSLDQKRNEVEANDIPDVIARYHNLAGEADRTRKDQSFLVPAQEIRDNGYDLSFNKYKEVEREVVEYEDPQVILNRIQTLEADIQSALADFQQLLNTQNNE